MECMFVSPENSYAEALTPRGMVLGCGALRVIRFNEVMRVGPLGGMSVLKRRDQSMLSLPPSLSTT